MYRTKRSLVIETREKTAILTPVKNKSAFLVSMVHEGVANTGLIHMNELVALLDDSLKGNKRETL